MRTKQRSAPAGRSLRPAPLSFRVHAAEAAFAGKAQAAALEGRRPPEPPPARRSAGSRSSRSPRVALAFTLGGGSGEAAETRAPALEAGGLHPERDAVARRRPLGHDALGDLAEVEHRPADVRARTTRFPSSTGSTTSPSTRHSSSTTSSTARSSCSTARTSRRRRSTSSRASRRTTRAAPCSRRIRRSATRSRSGPGSSPTRPSRPREPRTSRSAPRSTRTRSPRSSPRTSSRAPSGSRRTRSCPVALAGSGPECLIPGTLSLPATSATPGWRNWSDAAGLKPAVPRDIWVRLPAPARPVPTGASRTRLSRP